MTVFFAAWAVCASVGAFVVLAVVVGLEIRDRRTRRVRPAQLAPAPQVPVQRSAAAIVPVRDVAAFDEFLGELIVTPHVEDVIS